MKVYKVAALMPLPASRRHCSITCSHPVQPEFLMNVMSILGSASTLLVIKKVFVFAFLSNFENIFFQLVKKGSF